MKITYSNEQDNVVYTHQIAFAVERTLETAAQVIGIDFAVNIMLTDALGIIRLNHQFRGIDGPTDVLSFPTYYLQTPITGVQDIQYPEWEDGRLFIGDIAIYAARVQRQADRYGHSIEREMAFLALHGVLHLLGYDHQDPYNEEIMRRKQREILSQVSLER